MSGWNSRRAFPPSSGEVQDQGGSRVGFLWGTPPWLAVGHPLAASSHGHLSGCIPGVSLDVLIPLLVKTPARLDQDLFSPNYLYEGPVSKCCKEGDPFQGQRVGSCLTLWMSCPRRHVLTTSKKTLLQRGTQAESSRVKGNQENFTACGSQSQSFDDGVGFRLVSGQSSCLVHSLIQGPSWWCTHVSARKDSSEKDSRRLVISSLCWSPLSSPG